MILRIVKGAVLIGLGFIAGAYLFADTQPRHFLTIKRCEQDCMQPKDLAGLLASIGVQRFTSAIPQVIMETDRTIVIRHPRPETPLHYLIIPKKDIKNIAEISEDDQPYIMDALAVIRKIVNDRNLQQYQVITNGPGQQQVTYLHFHLMAQEKDEQ